MTISALAGVGVVAAIEREFGHSHVATFSALLAGTVTLAVANEALCALGCRYMVADRFWPAFVEFIRFRARMAPFLVMIGLLAGAAGSYAGITVALAAPLLLGLQYVLAEHTRATRDRARTQGLFESSVEVHGHVDAVGVEAALCSTAGRLLRC